MKKLILKSLSESNFLNTNYNLISINQKETYPINHFTLLELIFIDKKNSDNENDLNSLEKVLNPILTIDKILNKKDFFNFQILTFENGFIIYFIYDLD